MKSGFRWLLLLLLVVGCGRAEPEPLPLPADFSGLSAELELLRVRLGIPGLSAAVAADGEVVWEVGLGQIDAVSFRPATAASLYRVGAITQSFTSTLVMQQVEQGRIDLDRPLSEFVGAQAPPGVTVRHLLSHTSESGPGSHFNYSSRYDWLESIVQNAAGSPFAVLMLKDILEPAGMTHTILGERGNQELVAAMAQPHRVVDGKAVVSDMPPVELDASSGLGSTAGDLARFGIALDEGRLMGEGARVEAMRPAKSTDGTSLPFGLGWFSREAGDLWLVSQTGWWSNAYSGLLLKLPGRGLTFAVLAASDGIAAPLAGEGNALISPFAQAFLRQRVLPQVAGAGYPRLDWDAGVEQVEQALESVSDKQHRLLFGSEVIARAVIAQAGGDAVTSDRLWRAAVRHAPRAVAGSTDLGLLNLLGKSTDPVVRQAAIDAGERRLAAFPGDIVSTFNLALAIGEVWTDYRVAGPQAARAIEMLEALRLDRARPDWMGAWCSYLIAERIAEEDADRARKLLQIVKGTDVDTDNLQSRARALAERLE